MEHPLSGLILTAVATPVAGQLSGDGGGSGRGPSEIISIFAAALLGTIGAYLASWYLANRQARALKQVLLSTLNRELEVIPTGSIARIASGQTFAQSPMIVGSVESLLGSGTLNPKDTWESRLIQEVILMRSHLLAYNDLARTTNFVASAYIGDEVDIKNWLTIAQEKYNAFLDGRKNVTKIIRVLAMDKNTRPTDLGDVTD